MKFRITRTSVWRLTYEDICEAFEEYPILKDFKPEIVNGNEEHLLYVEINSLNEFKELIVGMGEEIIIWEDGVTLEIYDDWRE